MRLLAKKQGAGEDEEELIEEGGGYSVNDLSPYRDIEMVSEKSEDP